MQYIRQLLDEAAALKTEEMLPENAPKKELQWADRLLGTVPEDVQRFYYLFIKKAKAINPRTVQIRHEAELLEAKDELTPGKELELKNELNRLYNQRDMIEKLFWDGVKESVPGSYAVKHLALRKDWQVVEETSQPEFSGSLLGSLLAASVLGRIVGKSCDDPNCWCHL